MEHIFFFTKQHKFIKPTKKTHLLLLIPNVFETLQIETFFGQNATERNRLVAMIEICFEKLNKNWSKSVLQIDALILVGQFIDVHIDRMNESLNQIGIDVIFSCIVFLI